jgi:hypothetical protein
MLRINDALKTDETELDVGAAATAKIRHKRLSSKAVRSQRVTLIASICVLLIIGTFAYLYYLDAHPEARLSMDWRFHIAILNGQTGKNLTIPANIGVSGGTWLNHTLDAFGPLGHAPLSTRDTSGTIYVQSRAPRLFVLSEFFAIWGKTYNSTCVGFDQGMYCSSAHPPLISNNVHEYCLSYKVPPMDNGKDWLIIINPSPLLSCQPFG